jgi:hypothetical protein
VLVPPYPPGSTHQPSLQTAVASPNLAQPMGHSNMMTTHPHYAPNSQAHFGVAAPVYPPGTTPGYYPGGSPVNGAQGQYVGGAGLAAVGMPPSPQSQMQFAGQTLPATLAQSSTFATFPSAHPLPPSSSSLVQAGAGANAGQFLPGANQLFLTVVNHRCFCPPPIHPRVPHVLLSPSRNSSRWHGCFPSLIVCSCSTIPLQRQRRRPRWQRGASR